MIRGDGWIAEALDVLHFNIKLLLSTTRTPSSKICEPERLTPGIYDFNHKAHEAHKERTKTV
jgi:hypothetical protein